MNGNPLQSSCLENSMNRGAWRATVYEVKMSRTRLSTHSLPFSSAINYKSDQCLLTIHPGAIVSASQALLP